MTDIAVIILSKNEKLHMKRCLERLASLEPRQIFVVDCFSTDGSEKIAAAMGATVVQHEWPGNQAKQFNWALDNLLVEADWILRLDADEWLTKELIEEIKLKLPSMAGTFNGIVLKRRHYFYGEWVKHGTYPVKILRIFRTGSARYDERMAMDEHLIVDGETAILDNDFVDESLISMADWKAKHRNYAKREASMALSANVNANKRLYYKFPPYFRAFAYFSYRYFFRLGFLDGYAGWMWNFWQALWYRSLVDQSISRMRRHSAMSFADCCLWTLTLPAFYIREKLRKSNECGGVSRDSRKKIVVFHAVRTLALEYGGPARSVQGLVLALENAGVEAHLVAIEECDDPWVEGLSHYHCLKAEGHNDVYRKMCELIDRFHPDIIHTHDCWMPILNMCHRAARDKGIPYIISPRGSLKTWSRRQKWLKKWVALKTYEGYDIRHAAALHVTADDEREQVAELGMNGNIFQLTNGLVFPDVNKLESLRRGLPAKTRRRALFLSRIHYTKGLVNLVEAWAKAAPDDWELEIVGTDADGYQAEVEKRVRELGIGAHVIFHGPASDEEKWAEYVSADLFVHPTFTENFGIVVAEALYAGLPVITTKGAPWKDLDNEKCGWWIDIGVEPLVDALREAFSAPVERLRDMGLRGRILVERKCSWSAIGKKMKAEYERIYGSRF